MTLAECYAAIDGDYSGVTGRLGGERLVQKFIVRFLKDDSYPQLQQALDEEDYETAFRAAHTLKGVCQNLGITVLFESSSALTEALRHRTLDNVDELMKKVSDDYGCTAAAIETFKTTNGL